MLLCLMTCGTFVSELSLEDCSILTSMALVRLLLARVSSMYVVDLCWVALVSVWHCVLWVVVLMLRLLFDILIGIIAIGLSFSL